MVLEIKFYLNFDMANLFEFAKWQFLNYEQYLKTFMLKYFYMLLTFVYFLKEAFY